MTKKYMIEFRLSDGTIRMVPIEIPLGPEGKPGESAWEAAVKAGYPDSEEQFYQDLAKVNDPFTYDDFTEEQLASLKGNPGESAYEAAVKGGYTGTLEQFYEDLAKNGQGGDVDLDGYATEQWVQEGYQPKGEYLTEVPDGYAKTEDIPTKPEDIGALPNTYTPPNQTAEQVGADPKGTASSAVSQHNTAEDSHNDIRLELNAINDRLTAFFDSDNQTLDELSEIVAYITSNKSLIDSITTSKVSVADIVNNLTSNVSNKPLSAAQGVVLKGLIDTLSNNLANYQPKGDYALRSEIPTVPTKVSAFTNDAGYLMEHQDISGKLDVSELPTAINTALAQAKASGAFDGEDGQPGTDGVSPTVAVSKSGKVTTVSITDKNGTKTATINDGADGSPGSTGKDGTSVTVKSVSESSVDGGSNVVTFSDGKTVTIKNGSKGSTGTTGATGATGPKPVRGIDYWTEEDKNSMIQDVIDAIGGTPVFGTVDANNNIILSGALADGTYTIKYEDEDGNVTVIGTLNHTYVPEPTYTNQIPISTDTDGSIYNGTGYKTASRIGSSGSVSDIGDANASNPVFVTGFIPVKTGDVIRLKNCYIDADGSNQFTESEYWGNAASALRICIYNKGNYNMAMIASWQEFLTWEYVTATSDSDGHVTEFTIAGSIDDYIRLTLGGDPETAILTINEEITD